MRGTSCAVRFQLLSRASLGTVVNGVYGSTVTPRGPSICSAVTILGREWLHHEGLADQRGVVHLNFEAVACSTSNVTSKGPTHLPGAHHPHQCGPVPAVQARSYAIIWAAGAKTRFMCRLKCSTWQASLTASKMVSSQRTLTRP